MGKPSVSDLCDAIAKALGAVSDGDGWRTQQELADATGRSRATVRAWLAKAVPDGLVEVGQARRPKVTGITQIVPVYRLKGVKR